MSRLCILFPYFLQLGTAVCSIQVIALKGRSSSWYLDFWHEVWLAPPKKLMFKLFKEPAVEVRPCQIYNGPQVMCDVATSRSEPAQNFCPPAQAVTNALTKATIHDTFPMPQKSKMVWVSCKDFATANLVKRKVALLGCRMQPGIARVMLGEWARRVHSYPKPKYTKSPTYPV